MFSNSRRFQVQGNTIRSTTKYSPKKTVAKSSAKAETASLFGAYGLGAMSGNSTMNVHATGPLASVGMLSYLVPQQEDMLRMYYRDIYYYDSVCGATVDMISSFPFSEYTLTGCDQNILNKYEESMVRLNIRTLMPDISTIYLVDGQFVSSLVFNKKEKIFIDVIVYPVDNCKIDPIPFYSSDPIITVKNTESMVKFMMSNDKQAMAIRSLLPASMISTLRSSAFQLDPLTTLYMARRTLPGEEPTSFLKRVLPVYLLEKTLYRGTIVEANKRQRSMLHVQMGDDTHEFTPEEMAETVNQFQLADLDPLGAVIGTRNNVQATELRQGGDFWKWTDTIDVLTPYKLRALGTSEAFLSGDATYSNVETALSVFLENADAYRSYLTYEVFTNKIFPLVAVSNDFFKKGKKTNTDDRTKMTYQLNNANDLEIPILRWHKRLEAKEEENVMDVLTTLEEKGMPIPLRMWAAAGKVDLNAYYQDLEQDHEIRKKIKALTDANEYLNPTQPGSSSDDAEFAALRRLSNSLRRKNLLTRDFGELGEVKGTTKTGKAKYIRNQKEANARVNKMISQAVVALNDPNIRRSALKKVQAKLGTIPNILEVPAPRR
jgi:hypothetical protein